MSILIVILLPLMAILFLPLKKKSRPLYYSTVCALAVANIIILSFVQTHLTQIDLGLNIVFLVDKYSWFFAFLINVAWLITTIYSFSFVSYDFQKKAGKFNFYIALVVSSALATGFA